MTLLPLDPYEDDDPLHVAEGIGLPAFLADSNPACARLSGRHFSSMEAQQAAFDGEAEDRVRDYAAAREICHACPLLFRCREWAYASQDQYAFLGGETAEVRRKMTRLGDRVRHRRGKVQRLAERHLSPVRIAEILGVDPTTVRDDMRHLGMR